MRSVTSKSSTSLGTAYSLVVRLQEGADCSLAAATEGHNEEGNVDSSTRLGMHTHW